MTAKNNSTIASIMACLVTCVLVTALANSESPRPSHPTPNQKPAQQMRPLNSLIGEWKGVGQLKRGSKRGAWTEKLICEWRFGVTGAKVLLRTNKGRLFDQLELSWNPAEKQLHLHQKTADSDRHYYGTMPAKWPGRVVLKSPPAANGHSYRCTIQQLSDIRTTLLFERRTSPTGSFRRTAGIGYTRAGTKLAVAGGGQRKCIVTGGLATIPVVHKGKTYYVCCQGCVQAFNENPETFVAEYKGALEKLPR